MKRFMHDVYDGKDGFWHRIVLHVPGAVIEGDWAGYNAPAVLEVEGRRYVVFVDEGVGTPENVLNRVWELVAPKEG